MKRFQQLVIASALLAAAGFAYAGETNTLQMTIINNTDMTLSLDGVSGENPGNTFEAQGSVAGHGSMVITGTTTQHNDLAGYLHFRDSAGHDHALIVIDPRNMHIVQPLFNMRNAHLHSTVTAKTRGKVSDPDALFLSRCTVQIDVVE